MSLNLAKRLSLQASNEHNKRTMEQHKAEHAYWEQQKNHAQLPGPATKKRAKLSGPAAAAEPAVKKSAKSSSSAAEPPAFN